MQNLLTTVQQVRATYGPTMTDDECAELCNTVAWMHRADGWGINRKTSGTLGTLPNGVQIAHDILHYRPTNELVDCLQSAGAASTPTWNPVGPPQSADRTWLAPYDPALFAPAPPTTPAPSPDAVLDAIKHLHDRLDAMAHDINVTAHEVLALRNDYRRGMIVSLQNRPFGPSSGTVKSPQ
jgi:hypothetical protein